ncbi:MAG: hypothetical protein IT236_08040 [Bacteroidia bacterium]|nr:hypothetical protein [Bacteroidia bacterium]
MRRLHIFFFLVLASIFCVKEIASSRMVNSDYTCCLEDISEDGQNSEESDTDSELDLLFSNTFEHEFQLPLSACRVFKNSMESLFNSPYYEIQLPPPERI